MTLQDITCTLEQAKYFQEHDLFQDSLYCLVDSYPHRRIQPIQIRETVPREEDILPMPTAEEIIRELPREIEDEYYVGYLGIYKMKDNRMKNNYNVQYSTAGADNLVCDTIGISIAQALADMYIHLHKNNLLS